MKIEEIQSAKHILLIANSSTFCNASALYTYILTLHKKVSLQVSEPLDKNLSFLPWFDKARKRSESNADLVIEVDDDVKALFNLLQVYKIKINIKLATALYSSLLKRYRSFRSEDCDGTVFAIASELISLKADYKTSHDFLQKRVSISSFRLKAIFFKEMIFVEEATHVKLFLSESILKASGASLQEAIEIMNEILTIVHVEKVTLYKSDENNKILKEID